MKKSLKAAVVGAALAIPQCGLADESDAADALLMWSAFQCSTLAAAAADQEQSERLFMVGYEAGRRFYSALVAGSIPEADIHSKVPIGVSLVSQGPTTEFIIGRVFGASQTDARDKIVKQDNHGLPLPEAEWVLDDELRKSKARSMYSRANCDLL